MRVGVLALQGDFAAHARVLSRLGGDVAEVRKPGQLDGLDGLVMPGGESTTLLKLMEGTGFEEAIPAFAAAGGALFGTCAGLILLAREVTAPAQRSFGLMDVKVARNAYGRQLDSFEAPAEWAAEEVLAAAGTLPLVFIRAPRILERGPEVEPLVRCRGDVVLARQGRILGGAFHPELSGDDRVHAYFLEMISSRVAPCPA